MRLMRWRPRLIFNSIRIGNTLKGDLERSLSDSERNVVLNGSSTTFRR